jgi:hypothetical protein
LGAALFVGAILGALLYVLRLTLMKARRLWLFLSIYLLVTGSIGFVVVSASVGAYCAIGLGCSGDTIIHLFASIIIEAWPFILIFLMPVVIFGGAVFLSLNEGKNEK